MVSQQQKLIHLLQYCSLGHSFIYAALLTVWLIPGMHRAEFIFGLTHGIGWIAMSLVSIACAAKQIIPLRTAAAVAILGGVGPFFGTIEFFRLKTNDRNAQKAADLC